MSKLRLVREIAEKTGRSLSESARFVSEVGQGTARRAIRGAEARTTWRLPALAGIGTGGVLLWRQQNVREAEAIADDSRNTMEALSAIMATDGLTPEQKTHLAESIGEQGESDDETSRFPELPGMGGLGGDLQSTILMIIVLLVIISFAVNFASNVGTSAAQGGVLG